MGHERTWENWWVKHEDYYPVDGTEVTAGREYVAQLLEELRQFAPTFSPRSLLDFGCGIGRILAPLATAFPDSTPIGVDISDAAIEQARKSVTATFVNSTREEIPGGFDLLHSFIVFQHIPVRDGLARLDELLGKLAPNGIGVVHLIYAHQGRRALYYARQWLPGLHNLIQRMRGKPVLPFTPMYPYPLDMVFRLLQLRGCHRVQAHFSDHDGHLGVRLMFEKRALPLL
jgi:2-polyprenyl-3-methyl-5-hydroxy-6-metoxy-1,4-benzoquinol methylase